MKIILIILTISSTISSFLLFNIHINSKNKYEYFEGEENVIFKEVSFGIVEINSIMDPSIKFHVNEMICINDTNDYAYIEEGSYLNPVRRVKGVVYVEITSPYEISIKIGRAFDKNELLKEITPMVDRLLVENSIKITNQ